MIVGPGFTPSCCVCSTKNYYPWKLIGVAVDVGCQVIKCILPLVLCEKCFRKRFCFQVQTPYLCGIAVFPPVEPSTKASSPAVPISRVPLSSAPSVSEVASQSKESGADAPSRCYQLEFLQHLCLHLHLRQTLHLLRCHRCSHCNQHLRSSLRK